MLSWTKGLDSCGCTTVPDTGVGAFVDPSQDLVHLHLTFDSLANNFRLNPNVPVTSAAPPTFLLQNEDDHVDRVEDALSYYAALKKAGVPVEMHLYAQGGHAFGLRRTKFPATQWPQLVETWLRSIGMI